MRFVMATEERWRGRRYGRRRRDARPRFSAAAAKKYFSGGAHVFLAIRTRLASAARVAAGVARFILRARLVAGRRDVRARARSERARRTRRPAAVVCAHDTLELPARLAAVAAEANGQVHGRGVDRDGAVDHAARQEQRVAGLQHDCLAGEVVEFVVLVRRARRRALRAAVAPLLGPAELEHEDLRGINR